jgi:hypothetical protein
MGTPNEKREMFGLLAEFGTPAALMKAAETVRETGYTKWDCYSPFPVHGLDRSMGLRDTRLPWVVLVGGITGFTVAILMQWWMNAVSYPLIIAGKPLFGLPANIPVAFELTVLFSALSAFAAMFIFNGLPRFYHPVFRSERFRRATNNRFFISIEARDPKFDLERTEALLRSAGSDHVEWLED